MRLHELIVKCHIETARKFFSVLNGTYKWENELNVDKFGWGKERDVDEYLSEEAAKLGHLDIELLFENFVSKFESGELRPGEFVKDYAEQFRSWIVLHSGSGLDDIEYRTIRGNCEARFNLFAEDLGDGVKDTSLKSFNIVGKR